MATDYDTPRKTDDDVNEDSIEELKARRNEKSTSAVDVDEFDQAETPEKPPPGAPPHHTEGGGVSGVPPSRRTAGGAALSPAGRRSFCLT